MIVSLGIKDFQKLGFQSYVQYVLFLFILSCSLYIYEYGGRRLLKLVRVNTSYVSINIYCLVVSEITFSTTKLALCNRMRYLPQTAILKPIVNYP